MLVLCSINTHAWKTLENIKLKSVERKNHAFFCVKRDFFDPELFCEYRTYYGEISYILYEK